MKIYKPKIVLRLLKQESEEATQTLKKKLAEEIIAFMFERLKNFLKENHNVRSDVIKSVIDNYINNLQDHKYGDIIYLARKTKFINELVQNSKCRFNSALQKMRQCSCDRRKKG